ncbi:HlyD family secretion protein [Thermodesulfobacteriota bacterium]
MVVGTTSPPEKKEEAQNTEEQPTADQSKSGVKKWTALVLLVCLVLLVLHVLFDKFTPYTGDARIQAFIVPIVPQVSGSLTEVNVENNQVVTEAQVLAVVDSSKYALAVEKAQANLQLATQTSAVDVSAVSGAQAKVAEAEANLSNAQVKGQRIIRLAEQGAASQSRADDSRSKIAASKARLASARSELEKAKNKLGGTGENNANVQQALVALNSAQLDLYRSTIRAPSDGIITNLLVDIGHFAATGKPIMTLISIRNVWVQADIRENALTNVKAGNQVELVLDAAPGRVFQGEVLSVGYGVSDSARDNLGGLATVKPTQGWLRQAQHIPVLIKFSDDEASGSMRVGGQVNVQIYTDGHPLMKFIGKAWIRIIALLSHLY